MPITVQQFSGELVDAHERLLSRREARHVQFFREGLLGKVEEVQIAGEAFHPADILEAMAAETFRIAWSESEEQFLEDVAESVLSAYPSPIALAFNAFKYGSKQSLVRLGFMRDTWEAAVSVIFTLVLSECAARNWKIAEVLLRDGRANNPRSIRNRDLFSDKIATRLGCIEGVLLYARVNGLPLMTMDLVPVEVVDEMRRLNDVRNGFSHEQTKSEKQAQEIIEECEGDLLDVLADLEGLQEAEFCRLHGISKNAANTLEIERLSGHVIARRILDLPVQSSGVAACAALVLPGDFDPVCIHCRGEVFAASPYFYCADDDSGHQTRMLFLKQIRAAERRVRYEISGQSETLDIDLVKVQPEIDRMKLLMQL